MKKEIIEYLNSNFPNLSGELHIRFELGEPFPNGSDRRIKQVNKRVITIFQEIFDPNDFIFLYIKDWEDREDPMFVNTTPDYLYELLNGKVMEEEIGFELDEDEDEEGNTIEIKNEYQIKVLNGLVSSFPYRKILEGISHYEQGREPSLGQSVFFINKNKDIIFHMYDDRGCIIHSNSKEHLRTLYIKYNDWIVDYWRDYLERLFKEE
ncbi:hypothetical protein QE450_001702 [Paenibacillus sp. SORGH_AS306]|uniref:DUF3885 domain-containing protein n=1 Tax=unclassified Paenibacillus TaxID=185978 RepID=UPI002787F284|nr:MULTISPECIES: DUF3885 domain-containing protein [unclassified Paenibacillus]MDQ1234204.1 hypothetical protein [Paenibacillus sp. SORGH_AS_0306]MDR6111249.1 hypothetical protein [Paenibacillus sp. SORGH_AS_0338]